MLSSYKGGGYNDAQADAVAELLYHCGANVEMNYSVSASGTQTSRVALALSEVFGYSPLSGIFRKRLTVGMSGKTCCVKSWIWVIR